tara:strand:- start:2909 stop:3181 length:273 start_codon:yes stop_codon:yes gene_type:complete
MARTKLLNGEVVALTAEEESARDAEEAQAAIEKAAYDADYSRKRREAYNAAGCTIEALAIATFESVFADDSAAAVKLQIEREKIKAAIPK